MKGNIIVYNTKNEDHTQEPNNFYIGKGSILANPFTFNGKRSNLAKMSFKTREEAVDAYEVYFNAVYGVDPNFTKSFDEIYEHYKNGEDVYLQCFCKPKPCHGDVIAKMLQRKLLKDKIREFKKDTKDKKSC